MRERGMQRGSSSVSFRTRGPAALVFITIISLLFFNVIAETSNNSQVGCSKTCVAENCNSIGIRYGKYCGVGWSGCPGEKPCDDLDACCKIHDECVEKKGLTDVKCHEKFKKCIKKVQKSGKVGFSGDCPYDTAVPTMVQGMDLAIMFSQFGNSKVEL
ncbi:probable phospholipase A2 homolog 1 [Coffea arabica]|uniref:Probable phospholipase A2 homolog 1 n=1 Tax=Coffea arabica TaxID=13443 RepID=A0A6P6SIU6_COFAR